MKGSVGTGRWTAIPWVAIYDINVTNSAQKGEYIIYLLSVDDKTLYLTFNQGCEELEDKYGKFETIKKLKENSSFIQKNIESRGFSKENISLLCEGKKTKNSEMYMMQAVFFRKPIILKIYLKSLN